MNNLSGLKILIVEDEAIVAMEIQHRLMMMGHVTCGIVASGEKAIISAGKYNPDLILMDIKLKGQINGIEAAIIIKEKFFIPSVFITAFSDENTIKQIKDKLNYEYLFKPFEEEELIEAIRITLAKIEIKA